jgi:hypothetical protein
MHREYWAHWIRVRRVDFASSESRQQIQQQNCTAQPQLGEAIGERYSSLNGTLRIGAQVAISVCILTL